MTQNKQIRKHLESGFSITPLGALRRFQCFRLASRIAELKASGMQIDSQMIVVPSGKRVAEYSLVK